MDELWRSEDANTVVKEAPVGGGGVDCSNDADALAIALKEKEKQREQQLEIVKAEKEHDPLEQQVVLTTITVTDSSSSTIATIATAIAKKKRHFEEVEPVVWHLSHRPSGEKTRKKLTLHDDIAQIGFGGCGGMYNYFLGVASVLQEEYDLENVIFSGVSAGCFPAMILALGIDVKEFFFKENIPLIEHAASCSYSGLGKWIPLVKANTLKMLPEDAYKQANQKLYFSVTELPALKNHVITTWENNEDMVDCMLSSGHVPLYTDSLVSTYRGMKLVDGGLSNNSPIVHPDRPHKMLQIWKWRWISPTWILVTTNADWALEMFRMGREDALKNLHEIEDAFFPVHMAKRTRLA